VTDPPLACKHVVLVQKNIIQSFPGLTVTIKVRPVCFS
jgi:hypothetical protein